MAADIARLVRDGVAIVAADGLAARQWEAVLAAERLTAGERAWLSPAIVSYRAWANALWSAQPHAHRPLTPLQSSALWRRVVAESPEGAALIGSDGAATWAEEAWGLLCNWLIDPAQLSAATEHPDFNAFLRWCGRYREVLAREEWVDHASIDARLPSAEIEAPTELVLADLASLTPAQHALLRRVEDRGCRIERWTVPAVRCVCRRVALADAAAELRAAVGWARRRLEISPQGRIAIVVADLAQRGAELDRCLSGADAAYPVWRRDARLPADPLLGAALDALELLTPDATFTTFSRWLRSPFFGDTDATARVTIERRLREELSAQLPFLQAYYEAGVADGLRRDFPAVAGRLDHALEQMTDRIAPLSRWIERWQPALTALGWPPPSVAAADPTLAAWQAGLTELAQLTPIVGDVTAGHALHELDRIVRRRASIEPLPLAGVHVFGDVEEVGPGYDAAWLTGFTDSHWPQARRTNPLLPWRLQRAHAMPWHSPQDAHERSARLLRRLLERVAEIVISWPARVYDYAAEPSPAIVAFPELPAEELGAADGLPAQPAPRARETLTDDAPPLLGDVIGGVGALNRQARCPLRAFCEYRLAARPIETPAYGMPARLQGLVAHRALELLLADLPDQSGIERLIGTANDGAIARCVEQALAERFRGARRPLAALFRLEHARHTRQIFELLEHDARRAAFRVEAVERRLTLTFDRWSLRVRVDRLDRLADGSIAIVDYKTGKASTADWFKERLRDTQVPLYAVHAGEQVSAAVLGQLGAERTGYIGVWQRPGEFPAQSRPLPAGRSWAEQLHVWRRQIRELIDEFVAGDVRLFASELDEARGAYAPLTRVLEQLALHRGALRKW